MTETLEKDAKSHFIHPAIFIGIYTVYSLYLNFQQDRACTKTFQIFFREIPSLLNHRQTTEDLNGIPHYTLRLCTLPTFL